jgi:transposase-like protein
MARAVYRRSGTRHLGRKAAEPIQGWPDPLKPLRALSLGVWFSRRSEMARRKRSPEEIIGKLREAEVLLAQGKTVGEVCRSIGVTEQTYYRWRNEYGGLKVDQARRLKELERENALLRKAVSDLTLDKMTLKEAASGNF